MVEQTDVVGLLGSISSRIAQLSPRSLVYLGVGLYGDLMQTLHMLRAHKPLLVSVTHDADHTETVMVCARLGLGVRMVVVGYTYALWLASLFTPQADPLSHNYTDAQILGLLGNDKALTREGIRLSDWRSGDDGDRHKAGAHCYTWRIQLGQQPELHYVSIESERSLDVNERAAILGASVFFSSREVCHNATFTNMASEMCDIFHNVTLVQQTERHTIFRYQPRSVPDDVIDLTPTQADTEVPDVGDHLLAQRNMVRLSRLEYATGAVIRRSSTYVPYIVSIVVAIIFVAILDWLSHVAFVDCS